MSTPDRNRLPARPRMPAARSVIVFAGLDWWYHNQAHADFQLALRMAPHRRVLVVNSIGTRFPRPGRSSQPLARIGRKLRSVVRLVRQPRADLPGFYVYSPVTVPAYGSPLGRRLNALLLRLQLSAVTRWLRMPRPDVVVTPPTAWDVVAGMRRGRLLFNRSDKLSAWAEVSTEHLRQLEEKLLTRADAVLYVAHSLQAEEAPLTGDRAMFLDHGVDLSAFAAPGPVPADLLAIPGPRVGYLGALRDHTVDAALLATVAGDLPDISLVLIGPSTMDLNELLALPNVHWLGQRPYETMPAYGAGLDVALMPWLDNAWIKACNPIKMKEYLALGLPIVSTDFPEARRYADVIDLASDGNDFVRLVRAAVRSGRSDPQLAERRRAAVANASWDSRAAALMRVLDGHKI